jgi:predicted ArsR family transcriptional regulator
VRSSRTEISPASTSCKEEDEGFIIRGYGCPLAAVTPGHPEVCRIAEALISELATVPVREHCDREAKPRCCFEVALPENTAQE